MTMHMVRGMTTLKASPKKKLNAKQQRALAMHNEWLKSQGVHPTQISVRQVGAKSRKLDPKWTTETKSLPPLSNKVGNGLKNDIWEKIRKGQETPETIEEIKAKATRIAPAYNKGPLQYVTPGMDPKTLGRKI